MPCKCIMRRIIWERCSTRSPSSQPQLGANRQTDAASLTSPPFLLMRSQHLLNKKKKSVSAIISSISARLRRRDLRRPLEVLPFFSVIHRAEGGKHSRLSPPFSLHTSRSRFFSSPHASALLPRPIPKYLS